jgi:hypothetical protein
VDRAEAADVRGQQDEDDQQGRGENDDQLVQGTHRIPVHSASRPTINAVPDAL